MRDILPTNPQPVCDHPSRPRLDSRSRPWCRALVVAAAVCLAASCSSKEKAGPVARPVIDELGRAVVVRPNPERIVSLAPSITEILFALGLGDRVAAVTSYCDYPAEAARKEKVGDTLRPNIERIVALKADLVIASTASQLEQFVVSLEQVGVPVYVSNPRDLAGVLETIKKIGELTGVEDRADRLTGELQTRIDSIQARTATGDRPRVLLILGVEPLITAGGSSFINDLITRSGGQSISADEKADYPQYSLETAIQKQPEVIFLQAGQAVLPARLANTPAARAGRVYRLDDNLLLRPGPRVVDGLEQMTARIMGQ